MLSILTEFRAPGLSPTLLTSAAGPEKNLKNCNHDLLRLLLKFHMRQRPALWALWSQQRCTNSGDKAEKGSSRTIQHRGRVERPWKNVQWTKKQRVASRMLSLWHSWRCWEFNIQEPQEFDNAGLQHLMKQNYWACVHRKIRATPGLITKLLVHILWEGVMRLQDILPCAWKNSKETVHCQRFKTLRMWQPGCEGSGGCQSATKSILQISCDLQLLVGCFSGLPAGAHHCRKSNRSRGHSLL